MRTFSDTYRSAKENYLQELKNEYSEWANRFHNRFNSWVVRLFGDDYVYLNVWSKGWEKYTDAKCIRIDLDGGGERVYICEEENHYFFWEEKQITQQRSQRDNDCDWYRSYPEDSIDPIGNYETLIRLLKDKLSQYGEVPPQKQ